MTIMAGSSKPVETPEVASTRESGQATKPEKLCDSDDEEQRRESLNMQRLLLST